MDASDLETYEYQLSQIKLALAKDPSNTEYLTLKDELTSLVEMTKEYLASAAPAPPSPSRQSQSSRPPKPSTSTSTSSAQPPPTKDKASLVIPPSTLALKSGDECQARYSGDGKFYPARITSVGGSDTNRVFSVIFQGYESTELVSAIDVKSLTESKKRALALSEEDLEKERKKKKNEKKADTRQVKTQEQGERQKSWQSFAKKAVKKGKAHVPGFSGEFLKFLLGRVEGKGANWFAWGIGESMFKSPEDGNPQAKVGVVNSGKGMTKGVESKRQTFKDWAE
ncbi:survival of motor neuron-related-splicing factor 30, partial [Phenoliferia sp. Uapishka_3]